jgi:hypothetical protein
LLKQQPAITFHVIEIKEIRECFRFSSFFNTALRSKPAAMAITQLRMFLIMTSATARSTIQQAIPDSTAVDFMGDTIDFGLACQVSAV